LCVADEIRVDHEAYCLTYEEVDEGKESALAEPDDDLDWADDDEEPDVPELGGPGWDVLDDEEDEEEEEEHSEEDAWVV
jgi:hypothetical protein